MLKELAIADAYGAAFEFVKNPDSHELINDGVTFQKHPKYELGSGKFTDDTIRSMANADFITMRKNKSDLYYNQLEYVTWLRKYFWRFYRKGWSGKFQQFLEEHKDSTDLEVFKKLNRSNTNGSIMGVLPLGYLPTENSAKLAASTQALSTHSWETIPYAQAMALSAHYFLYKKGRLNNLQEYLLDTVDGLKIYSPKSYNSMLASDTAMIVLDVLRKSEKDLKSVMIKAVSLGGDTDSVAALSVGICSCCEEFENNILDLQCEAKDNEYLYLLDTNLKALMYEGI